MPNSAVHPCRAAIARVSWWLATLTLALLAGLGRTGPLRWGPVVAQSAFVQAAPLDALVQDAGPGPASAASLQGSCRLVGGFVRLSDAGVAAGVPVLLLPPGRSTVSDAGGGWTFESVESGRVTVRVIAPVPLLYLTLPFRTTDDNRADTIILHAGTTDVVFEISSGCILTLADVREVTVVEGPVSRPSPPPLPAGFVPSEASRAAPVPLPATTGNPGNVPWIGYFWLTAPAITVGICDITDPRTRSAAELAVDRWKNAPGLGWQIVRDDEACNRTFPQPKALITQETVPDGGLLGYTTASDIAGKDCDVSQTGNRCWVGLVNVVLTSPGLERVSEDQRVATVLHELGHALGLGHSRGCGDSVMWFDTRCETAPTLYPGVDDIGSLNELLAATLGALRP